MLRVVEGIEGESPLAGVDKGKERETRKPPCARTTWCIRVENHEGPCEEVPRAPQPAPNFGPGRGKR